MKIGAREARNPGSVGFTVSAVEATANLRGPRIEIWAFWGKTRPLVWLGSQGWAVFGIWLLVFGGGSVFGAKLTPALGLQYLDIIAPGA